MFVFFCESKSLSCHFDAAPLPHQTVTDDDDDDADAADADDDDDDDDDGGLGKENSDTFYGNLPSMARHKNTGGFDEKSAPFSLYCLDKTSFPAIHFVMFVHL